MRFSVLLVVSVVIFAMVVGGVSAGEEVNSPLYARGEIIIQFSKDPDISSIKEAEDYMIYLVSKDSSLRKSIESDVSGEKLFDMKKVLAKNAVKLLSATIKVPDLTNRYKFNLRPKKGSLGELDIPAIVKLLGNDPKVLYAEPNYLVRPFLYPNDEEFSANQWNLHNTGQAGGTPDADIDAPEAWDVEQGSENIVIAIIDTGIDYNHIDLSDNIWVNEDEIAGDEIDNDNNGFIDDYYGYDFGEDDGDPYDTIGHGTQQAGIAAAVTNNTEGIAGVCWNCKIMALKISASSGQMSHSDAADAIYYAVQEGADIISMSWGEYITSQTLEDAVNYALNQGLVLIAAAGNEGDLELIPRAYPASYEGVIAVGATGPSDIRYYYSNYGYLVDVSAPGEGVRTTKYGGGYRWSGGSSIACPHVSGVAGLLLSQNPNLGLADTVARSICTADFIDNINPGFEGLLGYGRLNAYNALTSDFGSRAVLDYVIIDDMLYGNGNVFIDPNETVDLFVSLRNRCQNVSGVEATLSTQDECVYIINGSASFGDMAFFESKNNSAAPYSFYVNSSCSRGHIINFTLNVTADGGYESIYHFQEPISWGMTVIDEAIDENYSYMFLDVGDVYDDGENEIIIGYRDTYPGESGKVSVLSYQEGIWQLEDIIPSIDPIDVIKVGDADNDGQNEIVIASPLVIYDYIDGSWIATTLSSDSHLDIDIGDADNDGFNEIATPSYVFKYSDGSWTQMNIGGSGRAVKIGDADNDGFNEVYTLNGWYRYVAGSWESQGVIDTWPDMPMNDLVIGDLDHDGLQELVIGGGMKMGMTGQVKIYDYVDGSWIDTRVYKSGSSVYNIEINDPDNDGEEELVIVRTAKSSPIREINPEITMYDFDGENYISIPIINTPEEPFNYQILAIGEIAEDGIKEIVVGYSDKRIRILNMSDVQASECHDVSGDNTVNIIDLALVIFWQGKNDQQGDWDNYKHLDVNNDTVINFADVSSVIIGFGQSC